MTGYYKRAIDDLENQISELNYEQGDILVSYENAIEIVLSKTAELKEYILKSGFKSAGGNIFF